MREREKSGKKSFTRAELLPQRPRPTLVHYANPFARAPTHRATLVRESAPGVWQGECRVGDQIIEVNKKEVMYLDSKDIAAVLRFETQKRVSLELRIKRQQPKRNAIVGGAKNHGEFTVQKFPLSDLQCTRFFAAALFGFNVIACAGESRSRPARHGVTPSAH